MKNFSSMVNNILYKHTEQKKISLTETLVERTSTSVCKGKRERKNLVRRMERVKVSCQGFVRWFEIIYSKHSHHIVIWRLPQQWHTKKWFHFFFLSSSFFSHSIHSRCYVFYKWNILMYIMYLPHEIHDNKNNSSNIRSHRKWENQKKMRTLAIHISFLLFLIFPLKLHT